VPPNLTLKKPVRIRILPQLFPTKEFTYALMETFCSAALPAGLRRLRQAEVD
jgi:hypothetical protein